MLQAKYTPHFLRDSKKLARKGRNLEPLKQLVDLILQDTLASRLELIRHHDMHTLKGEWSDSNECHVAHAGDWLLIWKTGNGLAVFQRAGKHDDLFRS